MSESEPRPNVEPPPPKPLESFRSSLLAKYSFGWRHAAPSVLTYVNLLCGAAICVHPILFKGDQEWPWWSLVALLAVSSLADTLDGPVARVLKVQSDFGRVLDTLADLVSFGIAPVVIVALVYRQAGDPGYLRLSVVTACAVYVMAAAYRLALFATRTSLPGNYFYGVPSPAAAWMVLVAATEFPILATTAEFKANADQYTVPGGAFIVVTIAIFMVLPIPFWKGSLGKRMILIALAVVAAIVSGHPVWVVRIAAAAYVFVNLAVWTIKHFHPPGEPFGAIREVDAGQMTDTGVFVPKDPNAMPGED